MSDTLVTPEMIEAGAEVAFNYGVTERSGDAARDVYLAMAAHQWQPIETAPKDGRLLLLWCEGRDVPIMGSFRFDDNLPEYGAMWLDDKYDDFSVSFASCPLTPTHWMPLPESPK